MLPAGMKIFLRLSYCIAAIGKKHDLLVLLHSLRLQQFPQTATRRINRLKGIVADIPPAYDTRLPPTS